MVRVVFVFVGLLGVNVVFLRTYVQANNMKIEKYKLAAVEAASQAKAVQAEALLAQREAEKQKELAFAEADRLREALENCSENCQN